MPAFRILGGFSALSGTALTYYWYQSINDNNNTVDCKPFQYYDGSASFSESKPWNDNWDLREPCKGMSNKNETDSSVVEKKPTATRHVILVRHGQYVHSKEGRNFKVLTELGRQQAYVTGERLKSLNITFDRLVISTVVRAQETGKIIGDFLPEISQQNCSLLPEGSPYPCEPSYPDLDTISWKRQTFVDNPRIEGAFREYIRRADPEQEKDSYDLLVCHGNVIRYFVCRALQFPPEGWLRMNIGNCGITWISIRPNGRVSLRDLGDVGHLPSNMITFS